MSKSSGSLPMLVLAYTAFISLGIDASLMGVAWPTVRATFDLPLDAVGVLFMVGTVGFSVASFSVGRVASAVGLGPTLLLAHALRVVGLAGVVLSPVWWGVVLSALLISMGAAIIDTGQNFYISANHQASHMNWMHANFGVGATLGPLMLTPIITSGASWRWGYAVVGLLEILLLLAGILTVSRWQGDLDREAGTVTKNLDTLRLPHVWLGIAIFFLYTGIEAGAGSWAFTLFTESRSISETLAGRLVSIYWGMLTAGRIIFGFVTNHINVSTLLRTVIAATVVSLGLIWWNPLPLISFSGLVLLGLSLSTIFPVLVSLTPDRVGGRHAPNTIGFQVGAAGLGGAVMSSAAGVLADSFSLEVIMPFLLISAVIMFALNEFAAANQPTKAAIHTG